ncbi:hypothetical protein [Pseudomonas bharatica]|uniref:hypothetical protein n=1 Tax=Pseudomonas bharatica TaxID=2692112 RepID=UPI003B27CB24
MITDPLMTIQDVDPINDRGAGSRFLPGFSKKIMRIEPNKTAIQAQNEILLKFVSEYFFSEWA